MDLLLKNAVIVTVNKEREIIYDGAMAVDGGRIVAVGKTQDVLAQHPQADRVMDLDGKVLFPGFINTHNHLFQTLLKGLGDDMVLSDWLRTMTFPAAQYLEPEDCYYGAMLGCMEGIHSGMTTQLDYMYPHAREGLSDGVIKAYQELGIRGIFGRGCMDEGLDFGVCPAITQQPEQVEKDLVRIFDTYHNTENGRIKVWVAPAALWSNSEKMLRMLWEITNSYKSGFTVHVSETPFDRMATKALHGCEGTDCLEKLGILGDNVLMVHCVYLTEKDIRRSKYYDLKVSYNPVSNMYLSSGVAPIPQLLNAGVTCGLGVDGAASNNGQDMVELMKTASLLQKVHTLDPTIITAEKVLEMATIDGARAVGLEDEIGSLETGKKADFVVFNPYLSPKAIPMHNPVSTLVYSSTMQNIESVAVDGRFVMEDGVLTTVSDEKKLLREAQKTAESLCERGKITTRWDGHKWRSIAF
ncbi:MAG: amidohydrolase [Lachnospiraceae bacterium]|nr:amidohydrolase [Lachnospiraceae bacterium]